MLNKYAVTVVDILKTVTAVTRKSRYYGTKARTGIMKSDCTKPRETTQGTDSMHEKHRQHGNNTQEGYNTTKKQHSTLTQTKHFGRDMIQRQIRHVQRLTRHLPFIHGMNRKAIIDVIRDRDRDRDRDMV
jgi:hypothetical protein